ncbi:hypothetical protein JCM6882_002188 [Rhodosporidiobolus microsporus]
MPLQSLPLPRLYPGYLVFSAALARRGLSSGSLSRSGFAAAAVLGWLALANPLAVWGACLLGFYAAGSKATKVKADLKATYEESDHAAAAPSPSSPSDQTPPKSKAKAGGHRTALQVSCNALIGVLFALLWRVLYSGELSALTGSGGESWEDEGRWCVIAREEDGGRRWSRALVLGAVAFWGACCGDTFASELGILSPSPPYLPSTLRPTPRGTNGALSPFGTYVSFAGGILVSVLAILTLVFQGQVDKCGRWVNEAGEWGWAGEVLAVGGAAGLGGSLIDSLLGFLFQPTYYSPSRKLVVHHPPSSLPSKKSDKDGDDTILLPGTAVLGARLSNNGVNAVSTAVVAAVAVAYGAFW